MNYRVKNWGKFQHFKDRRPPWIKLYRDILDDIQWHKLDGDSAKLLVMIWVIASEDGGNLPANDELAFRLRITESALNSTISKLNHWLEQYDISMISERYQDDALEKEKEREAEEEAEREAEAEREDASKNSKAEPKGQRFDKNMGLSNGWYVEALKIRPEWNSQKCMAVFLEFKDYWVAQPGAKGRKADWLATWRNWCRREKGYNTNGAAAKFDPVKFVNESNQQEVNNVQTIEHE